jgi:DNA polymerase V
MLPKTLNMFFQILNEVQFPFIGSVSAGFPSPAADYVQEVLDIKDLVTKHPNSTYYGRVSGKSMINDGLDDGDILIIDKSLSPINGKLVVATIANEFTLKRIQKNKGKVFLVPANSAFPSIELTEEMQCTIWGVVTYVLKQM